MEFSYVIYKHTSPNGKVYIGQTKHGDNPNIRWKNGEGYKNNSKFYDDISKYGWDAFEHEILEENLSKSEANEKEIYYIDKYDSLNEGYNIAKGGNTMDHVFHKRAIYYIEGNIVYGSSVDASEALNVLQQTISNQCSKGIRSNISRSEYNFCYLEDMDYYKKLYDNNRIYQIDVRNNDVISIYNSVRDVYNKTNISINRVINGDKKHGYCHGYYWCTKEEYNKGVDFNNSYYKWDENDDKILSEFYPTEGIDVIKRMPYRTEDSIYRRASRLKIKYEK